MTNPEIESRTALQGPAAGTPLAAGRWRSISTHTWLVLRSGHGLASEVKSLGPAKSGTVDVYPEAERSVVRLGVDLRRLITGCESCQTTRADGEATLMLEATRVGPVTMNGWALAGTIRRRAATTAVESELGIRSIDQQVGEPTQVRITVRTQVPVAALGLCDTHLLGHTEIGSRAELLTHLIATRVNRSPTTLTTRAPTRVVSEPSALRHQ